MRAESVSANYRAGTLCLRIRDTPVYSHPGKPWEPSERVPACKGAR